MFDELCSIYSDALDNVGRYVDMETGECITEMSIHDFCLTDRWQPYVEKLRAMRAEFGSKAKKMPEYIETKKQLPGATLSGLFAIYDDECTRKDGSKYIAPVSRRESHLISHTGWLAIDIDLVDNQHLSDFNAIRMVCRFRPEIALLMRSCSGSGYFGLVRLAYPDNHKSQFRALLKEYAALGINLDKACSNIGRVRFASWDEPSNIYINERAIAYTGLDEDSSALSPLSTSRAPSHSYANDDRDITYLKASRLVSKIEAQGKDIMGSYHDWIRCGMALYSIDPHQGYDMWKRISRFRPADANNGHHERDFRTRWSGFANSSINGETFFWYCKQNGIELTGDEYREIYNR